VPSKTASFSRSPASARWRLSRVVGFILRLETKICRGAMNAQVFQLPSKMAARPPEFGEQTEEVLAGFGFGRDEIADLRQREIV
jgi:crotonobetainyl-CoA:carnitine CoA-transferase CaiB-like acyl-CoA transferase